MFLRIISSSLGDEDKFDWVEFNILETELILMLTLVVRYWYRRRNDNYKGKGVNCLKDRKGGSASRYWESPWRKSVGMRV